MTGPGSCVLLDKVLGMPLGSVEGIEEVGECNNVQDDDACDHGRLAGHVQGRLRHQALRLFHACDSHASNRWSENTIESSECVSFF